MATKPNRDYMLESLLAAQKVWVDWRDVLEHSGQVSSNPILVNPERFRFFCNDWKIARTIRAGTHDELRCLLKDSEDFLVALTDPTGLRLDLLHDRVLRPMFGTQKGRKGLISALSKVATFVKPDYFTAWDKYARCGLNRVLGRSSYAKFPNYAVYLADFNLLWTDSYGDMIREIVAPLTDPIKVAPRFQRRVLDLYLMREGGYDHREDIGQFSGLGSL